MNNAKIDPKMHKQGNVKKRVAILATDGFEEVELTSPKKALEDAGVEVDIIAPKGGSIKAWKNGDWSGTQKVDVTLDEADPEHYDSLMLPGGVINPDKLRREQKAVEFVRSFFNANKPVAAICHGPQLLIEADVVRGRRLTSFHSVSTDLKNAGAIWENSEVVVDRGLVTSRSPEDLEAFNRKMVEEVAEGIHHDA